MTPASRAIAFHGLTRRALSLGVVKAFEQAMQFLLPIVLVRWLDAATFGEYRLLWLAVGTVMALAQLNMGGGLYFFVPRSPPAARRVYVHQTLLYYALAGLACAAALGPWSPLVPDAARPLQQHGLLVPAFIALWMVGSLLDLLPTVDERIALQAFATATVATLRVALVGLGAWLYGEMRVILWLLVALAAAKLALLVLYVARRHGLGPPWLDRRRFAEQFRHCAPFGVSNGLFALRAHADQWIAASLFALSSFAAFSIAAIVGQVVNLFRHSVMEAFMPTMSRMHAAGDVRAMLEMNSRANALVGRLLYPLLAAAFVFAEEIVTVVYTDAYLEAAAVMRVYIAGMAPMVIEVGSVILLLRQGPFALKITAGALAASAALSWTAASHFGLAGAAAGSVIALYLDRALILGRISRLTGVPLGRVQDWRSLGRSIALSVLAAAAAWAAVERLLPEAPPFARLCAGFAVLAALYAPFELRRRRP